MGMFKLFESGKEIDFDLFGVYQGNRAKIKGGQ